MADILTVEKRNETGTARMRRLRNSGKVPAVLYGHGQDNVNLVLDARELSAVLRHSGHIVNLKGAVEESALIKDVLWDSVLQQVLHVDLSRVDASEAVEVELTVDLKGTARGTSNGGLLNHVLHEVTILCPAERIPEKLELKILDLDVGQSLRARDIVLP
ncbi:MAG: 50S ribosomal protein L25, partial [Planctomycetota bacterium]